MKKILTASLSLLLAIGCATKTNEPKPEEPPVVVTPEPTPTPAPGGDAWWKPAPMTSFIILSDKDGNWLTQVRASEIETGKKIQLVTVEAVPGKHLTCKDGYAAIEKNVRALKAAGYRVAAYHSLSYEAWRCDHENFPASAKGDKMNGWDEIWPDWRATSKAHVFWDNRYDQFAKIGFDCVEDDNEVDPKDNDSGFPLTAEQAEQASKRRADYAHAQGLCHLAKNNPSISAEKSRHSDGVMIEQARKYEEQDKYLPWKNAGKFGAMIEYNSSNCKPYPGFSVQFHSGSDYFNGTDFKVCE